MKMLTLIAFFSLTALSAAQTAEHIKCEDKLLDSASIYSLTEKWKAADNINLYDSRKQVKYKFSQTDSGLTIQQYIYDCDGILTRIAIFKNGKYFGDATIEE